MSFLGIFGKKGDGSGVRKHADRVANKRAQAYDRWDSIQALSRMRTQEAVAALLPRFTYYVEPSITDQEEKDAAFTGVVESGAVAVEPVVAFLKKSESVAWPLKMLDRLVPAAIVVAHLLDLLSGMDTEYERDPERKILVLSALAERKDERISPAVVRFLSDSNEPVRFATVGALVAQETVGEYVKPLVECLVAEDSVRVRNRILEALATSAVSVSPDQARVKPRLTPGFTLDGSGVPRKKG